LRAQRRDPGGRPLARHRLADDRLGRHGFSRDAYLSRRRLSPADPPADPDAGGLQRHHRVDVGDRGVRLSPARRLASGHRRLKARDPAGAGPLSSAVLGGVRRFRAGHAAVRVRRKKATARVAFRLYFFRSAAKNLAASASASSLTLASYLSGRLNFLPSSVASGFVNACTAPGYSTTR